MNNDNAYFAYEEWPSEYHETHLNAYKVTGNGIIKLVNVKDLCDSKPLYVWLAHGFEDSLFMCPHNLLF